jgi:WD40 repeat protein
MKPATALALDKPFRSNPTQQDGATATLDLQLPPGMRATIDGKDIGERRHFVFEKVPLNVFAKYKLAARFQEGKEERRTLLFKGGWNARLTLPAADQVRPEMTLQRGHTDVMLAAAFSPDGKQILTGAADRTAILWDAATGQQLRSFVGHDDGVEFVAFSPDGSTLLTRSRESAVLWEKQTGRRLHTFANEPGKAWFTTIMAFSPDFKQLVTQTRSRPPKTTLWEAQTQSPVRTLEGPEAAIRSAEFSADGRHVLAVGEGEGSFVWDVESGRRLRFEGHKARSALFSPDGKLVLTLGDSATVRLWDVQTGRELWMIRHNADKGVAFSPDGAKIATSSQYSTTVWNTRTGKSITVLAGDLVAFSPDGRALLTTFYDPERKKHSGVETPNVIIWDAETGEQLRIIKLEFPLAPGMSRPPKIFPKAVRISPDSQQLFTGCTDGTAILWDIGSGRNLCSFRGDSQNCVKSVTFSASGSQVLTVYEEAHTNAYGHAVLWDLESGRTSHFGWPPEDGISAASVALSPTGKHVLALGGSKMYPFGPVIVWDAQTGREAGRLPKRPGYEIESVAFAPDGKRIFTYSPSDNEVVTWETATLTRLRSFHPPKSPEVIAWEKRTQGHAGPFRSARSFEGPDGKQWVSNVMGRSLWRDPQSGEILRSVSITLPNVAMSPDGKQYLVRDTNKLRLLPETARVPLEFPGHTAAFSSDGSEVLTGTWWNPSVKLWQKETATLLRTFVGHTHNIQTVAILPNGKQALTGSMDGTARLWDLATGDELVRLISLDRGREWAVITPEGLFDGSKGGRETVTFLLSSLTLVPLDRFFQDFYYPGLLAEIWRGERPMPGKPFQLSPAPVVKMLFNQDTDHGQQNHVAIDVAVTDQGGGIKGPWLQHNGVTLRAGQLLKKVDKTQQYRFLVALVPGENRIEVRAATADGVVESEPALTTVKFDGKLPDPDLYVIAVGINRFAKDAGIANLDFCVPDAKATADLFRARSGKHYARVHVTPLYDEEATKANILKAVSDLSMKARPQDTLVLYMATHGYTVGQRFYLLPHDFRLGKEEKRAPPREEIALVGLRGYRGTSEQEGAVREHGLAIDELGEVLASVPALKRVLIFDACHSGSAIQLAGKRQNPFAFRGAMERFSRAQGVYSLSATAADELAAESKELGHSILTYSLLAALGAVDSGPLKGQKLASRAAVDVLDWFRFARNQVPALYKKYIGRPQHVELSGEDQPGFPLLLLPGS